MLNHDSEKLETPFICITKQLFPFNLEYFTIDVIDHTSKIPNYEIQLFLDRHERVLKHIFDALADLPMENVGIVADSNLYYKYHVGLGGFWDNIGWCYILTVSF